jgi:hypothetical protein
MPDGYAAYEGDCAIYCSVASGKGTAYATHLLLPCLKRARTGRQYINGSLD